MVVNVIVREAQSDLWDSSRNTYVYSSRAIDIAGSLLAPGIPIAMGTVPRHSQVRKLLMQKSDP